MADEALALAALLLLGTVAPLVLWRLVESEADEGPETDRRTAERAARRDTHDDARR